LPPGQHRRVAYGLRRVRMAVPDDRSRLLEPWGQPSADAVVPDRRLGAELRGRLPTDCCSCDARLVACRRSRSSGTSPGTSLTAALRESAARPTTPRAPGAYSARA